MGVFNGSLYGLILVLCIGVMGIVYVIARWAEAEVNVVFQEISVGECFALVATFGPRRKVQSGAEYLLAFL